MTFSLCPICLLFAPNFAAIRSLVLGFFVVVSVGLASGLAVAVPFESTRVSITGPSPHSPKVAEEIHRLGGNLFDQAIAVELALAVTHPYYASLGGGGFAVIRARPQKGKAFETVVLDFREVAPALSNRDLFKDKGPDAASTGGLAVAVPGVASGLWELHQRYGKLPWKKLFQPAIQLARGGFPVSGEWSKLTQNELKNFNSAGKKIFTTGRNSKDVPKPSEVLKQPELARALELLRDQGAKAFYSGPIAKDIVSSVKASGGILSEKDLQNYKAIWRQPLTRSFRGYQLSMMPLPSSGGLITAQGLEIYDRLTQKFTDVKPRSVEDLHLIAETLKLSFAVRGQLGDPQSESVASDIQSKVLDPMRLERLAQTVKLTRNQVGQSAAPDKTKDAIDIEKLDPALLLPELSSGSTAKAAAQESTETTHFSMADAEGNAIAFTVTLNGSYGSAVVSDRYGIALNDEMDDFAALPGVPNQYGLIQGEANSVKPGRRPLSSMSPTIIEKDGELFAVLGAPGGPRIASAVFQGALRLMVHGANAEEAVHWPRVHHQFRPANLLLEQRRTAPEVVSGLKKLGHTIADQDNAWVAKLYVIKREGTGILSSSADPRGEGVAGGF